VTPEERARCLDEDCEWTAEGPPWEIIEDIREHMQATDHQVATREIEDQDADGRRGVTA
jgi:hypothetical protein